MKEIILLTSTLLTALLGSCFFIFLIWFCFIASKNRKNRKIGGLVETLESPSESSLTSKSERTLKITNKDQIKPDTKKQTTFKVKVTQSMDKFPLTSRENDQQEEINNVQNFELELLKPTIAPIEPKNNFEIIEENIQASKNQELIEVTTGNNFITDNDAESNKPKVSFQISVSEKNIRNCIEDNNGQESVVINKIINEYEVETKRKLSASTETDEKFINYLPSLKLDKQVQYSYDEELKLKKNTNKSEFPKKGILNPISTYNRLKGYDPKNFVEKNIVKAGESLPIRKSTTNKSTADKLTPKPHESLRKSRNNLPYL